MFSRFSIKDNRQYTSQGKFLRDEGGHRDICNVHENIRPASSLTRVERMGFAHITTMTMISQPEYITMPVWRPEEDNDKTSRIANKVPHLASY